MAPALLEGCLVSFMSPADHEWRMQGGRWGCHGSRAAPPPPWATGVGDCQACGGL